MANITTSAAGEWGTDANWVGGAKPIPGTDRAILAHNMTVSTTESVGDSPTAGTAVITINAGKSLTVNPGGDLTVKGDIDIAAGSTLQVGTTSGAATLTMDGTSGTVKYKIRGSGASARVNGRGIVGGARSTIQSAGSGTSNASITDNDTAHPFIIDLQDTNTLRIGDSGVSGFYCWSNSSGDTLRFKRCKLQSGGRIETVIAMNAAAILDMDYVEFDDTKASLCFANAGASSTLTTGVRKLSNSVFDKPPQQLSNIHQLTWSNCYVHQTQGFLNANATRIWDLCSDIFLRHHDGAAWETCQDITGAYSFLDHTVSNPRSLNVLGSGGSDSRNHSLTDCTWELSGSDGSGDMVAPDTHAGTNLFTCTLTRPLLLPNGKASNTGTLVTVNNTVPTKGRIIVDHATCYADGANAGAINVSEAGTYTSDQIRFNNSIVWGPSGGTGFKVADVGTNQTDTDVILAANADYNCGFNLGAGSNLKGYNQLEFSSGTPGDHDIDVDPQFVDSTRCLPLVATSLLSQTASRGAWATATSYAVGDTVTATTTGWYGGLSVMYRCITAHTSNSGNATNGKPGDGDTTTSWRTNWEFASLYYIRKATCQSTDGYVATATIALSHAWVRAGFAPQNSAIKDNGSDGVTMGAMEYAAPASTGKRMDHRFLCPR